MPKLAVIRLVIVLLALGLPGLRVMAGVMQDEAGWTVVTPSNDTRRIYVSSSEGSDANNGLGEDKPVKSLRRGYALLRNRHPDWMLLKRGDEWSEPVGAANNRWSLSGRSAQEPMVVAAYGDETLPRPLIKSGGFGDTVNGSVLNHVFIMSLDLQGSGISWKAGGDGLLIEDCRITASNLGIRIECRLTPATNVVIRRTQILDCPGQGIYTFNVKGLTIEECLLDHNGLARHGLDHNAYLKENTTGVVLRGNIASRSGGSGLQPRAGGIIEDNLIIANTGNLRVGLTSGGSSAPEQGYSVVLRGNSFVNDSGAYLENINGAYIEDNLFIGHPQEISGSPLTTSTGNAGDPPRGVRDVNIRGNLFYKTEFKKARSLRISHNALPPSAYSGYFKVLDNQFWKEGAQIVGEGHQWQLTMQNNVVHDDGAMYPDPDRNIASYQAKLKGEPTLEAFFAAARQQRKGHWLAAYTAFEVNRYLRAGFGRAEVTPPAAPPVVAPADDAAVNDAPPPPEAAPAPLESPPASAPPSAPSPEASTSPGEQLQAIITQLDVHLAQQERALREAYDAMRIRLGALETGVADAALHERLVTAQMQASSIADAIELIAAQRQVLSRVLRQPVENGATAAAGADVP